MPPFIYPHRANGRGSKPRLHKWACPVYRCRETHTDWSRIAPDCPVHQVRMKEND